MNETQKVKKRDHVSFRCEIKLKRGKLEILASSVNRILSAFEVLQFHIHIKNTNINTSDHETNLRYF